MRIGRYGMVNAAILITACLAWGAAHAALPADTPTVLPTPTPVVAPTETPTPTLTMFGALRNFDVFNDTGQECHGFEIELDGVSSTDVVYTFGEPYERYGNPTVVDFAGGVYVRYESPYDPANQVFTQTTPMAALPITPTAGHACWTGGSPGYASSGCEHFGISLTRNPTATIYRWLVADSANPGALRPSGTKVSIPAPIWNVIPPTPGSPNPAPVVAAVIQAEPPEPGFEFGDAIWVKVFKTESPDPAELHHLVTDDPRVPQEQSETEVEWTLLQSSINAPAQLENQGQVADGTESVTRRYEFYQYTGTYDPENHEARPVSDVTPAEGDIGNYLGAQMAAINLGPAGPTPTPSATTVVPTETPTFLATDTPIASTPTPPPTSTPILCAGDCHSDGSVTVDEILLMVDIALGGASVDDCAGGNTNHDSQITVDEIIAAVNSVLDGCAH